MTPNASHVTPEASHVTPEASHVTPEAGHVTPTIDRKTDCYFYFSSIKVLCCFDHESDSHSENG